ncbi:hypothetical protein DFP72DRAFT_1143929 [Ephemerocybe angulata]|uniref:Uncharacterized protein n=1 Tax=Ephemerocybe angulata TaxID=980116 RepID=A0A8H6LYI6_9AGAR|nr:hypothetical protein DFP72DRAFT_1143929 [Tulosesus angulatus]
MRYFMPFVSLVAYTIFAGVAVSAAVVPTTEEELQAAVKLPECMRRCLLGREELMPRWDFVGIKAKTRCVKESGSRANTEQRRSSPNHHGITTGQLRGPIRRQGSAVHRRMDTIVLRDTWAPPFRAIAARSFSARASMPHYHLSITASRRGNVLRRVDGFSDKRPTSAPEWETSDPCTSHTRLGVQNLFPFTRVCVPAPNRISAMWDIRRLDTDL